MPCGCLSRAKPLARLFKCDPELVDDEARGRFDVVIAEVKSGKKKTPNSIWQNGETSHIEYLLRFVGWHKEDAAISSVAKDLSQKYSYGKASRTFESVTSSSPAPPTSIGARKASNTLTLITA